MQKLSLGGLILLGLIMAGCTDQQKPPTFYPTNDYVVSYEYPNGIKALDLSSTKFAEVYIKHVHKENYVQVNKDCYKKVVDDHWESFANGYKETGNTAPEAFAKLVKDIH